jgi:hypothetical protein
MEMSNKEHDLWQGKNHVSVDINVEVPSGIPDDIARIVDENRKALKFDNGSGFD